MRCYKVTGCSEEQRKSCVVWTSFEAESQEMEDIRCWVLKNIYHPDQKAQFKKCKKCKYYLSMYRHYGVIADIKDDMAVIRCEGPLNNDRVKALDELWESVKKSEREHVILDLSNVTNIYSCGIGLLIKMNKDMESMKGLLVLVGLHEFPMSLLKQFRLDSILNCSDTVDSAIKRFNARLHEREELKRIQEEEERIRNAPRKRMPCWEYWDGHNPKNATACSQCFRKITEKTDPCWIIDGVINGVSFQFVCEDCIGCSYYEEFKDTVDAQGTISMKQPQKQKDSPSSQYPSERQGVA